MSSPLARAARIGWTGASRRRSSRPGDGAGLTEAPSPGGEAVRRRLLAELFLRDACRLEAPEKALVDEMARSLTPELEVLVCAHLAHPRRSVGGDCIPEGSCCGSGRPVEKLLRLSDVKPDTLSSIRFLVPRCGSLLERLAPLGVVPGNAVLLHRLRPAVVVAIGETTLALDRSVAGDIFVTPLSSRS